MKLLDTYTVYYTNSDTHKVFNSLIEAKTAAENYCGNSRFVKPFPKEECYIYGPGDGTTSVMIRRDVEF